MSKFKNLTLFGVMFLTFLLSGNVMMHAQPNEGYVVGIVTDRVTEEPLIGVTVFFEGKSYGAVTDENGYYMIKHISTSLVTFSV